MSNYHCRIVASGSSLFVAFRQLFLSHLICTSQPCTTTLHSEYACLVVQNTCVVIIKVLTSCWWGRTPEHHSRHLQTHSPAASQRGGTKKGGQQACPPDQLLLQLPLPWLNLKSQQCIPWHVVWFFTSSSAENAPNLVPEYQPDCAHSAGKWRPY